MGEFSLAHWMIVLVILLLFFGPSKLPGLGSSLGKAIRGFKSGLNEIDSDEPTPKANNEQITSGAANSKVTQTEKEKEPQDRG